MCILPLKHVFYWFIAFWGARTLKKHQWSLRNINGFSHGGGSTYILLKIHNFPKNSRNFVNFHEFPWKSHIFHKMGARPPPWWKPLIFPRDFFCVAGGPVHPKMREIKKINFLWGKCKVSNIPYIFIKNREICDFPHFPVKRVSGTTNDPLGLSIVSALEAEGPPFTKNMGNL